MNLADYGVPGGVIAKGSPVEAAFLPDRSAVHVSNYRMYGPGLRPLAGDSCNAGRWDDSYLYKINTSTFHIDKVIRPSCASRSAATAAASPSPVTRATPTWP